MSTVLLVIMMVTTDAEPCLDEQRVVHVSAEQLKRVVDAFTH